MSEERKPDHLSKAGKGVIKAIGFASITVAFFSALIFVPVSVGAATLYFWPDFVQPNNHKFGAALLAGVFGLLGVVSAGGLAYASYKMGRAIFLDFAKDDTEETP